MLIKLIKENGSVSYLDHTKILSIRSEEKGTYLGEIGYVKDTPESIAKAVNVAWLLSGPTPMTSERIKEIQSGCDMTSMIPMGMLIGATMFSS